MKHKIYLGIALLLLSTFGLFAQSADQKAAMDAMMKAATPGEEHKKLSPMIGTWSAKVSMWMQPGAPPQVSTGTSTNKWVLGGRWVQESFSGSFMGKPFSGMGYTGYDNVTKQYVGTWMETASTGVMVSSGKAEDDKTFTYTSTRPNPVSGKPEETKAKITFVNKNKNVMEMWAPAPDGTQFKMMEITYTRKKS